MSDNMPHTEQGLKDYIRSAKRTLKDWEKRKPELEQMIISCEVRLIEIRSQQETTCSTASSV